MHELFLSTADCAENRPLPGAGYGVASTDEEYESSSPLHASFFYPCHPRHLSRRSIGVGGSAVKSFLAS